MKVPAPSLAPILRSDTQGRILARLLADPDVGYNITELVAWAGSSMPTVLREIERAEAAGIVTSTRIGPTRVVRANPAYPLYRPLREIVLATYGPPSVIADEFAAIDGIDTVVLFGSWAARYAGEPGRTGSSKSRSRKRPTDSMTPDRRSPAGKSSTLCSDTRI